MPMQLQIDLECSSLIAETVSNVKAYSSGNSSSVPLRNVTLNLVVPAIEYLFLTSSSCEFLIWHATSSTSIHRWPNKHAHFLNKSGCGAIKDWRAVTWASCTLMFVTLSFVIFFLPIIVWKSAIIRFRDLFASSSSISSSSVTVPEDTCPSHSS